MWSTSSNVIQQRGLQRRLLEMDMLFDPGQVLLGPGFLHGRADAGRAAAEICPVSAGRDADPASRPQAPYQIPPGLVLGIRNPHRRQVSGAIAARQFPGTPAWAGTRVSTWLSKLITRGTANRRLVASM